MLSKLLLSSEPTTWTLFAELLVAGAIVIFSGARFTRLASVLADRLAIGSGWIGLILLATVTSLPELVAGSTATAIGNVDLAFGAIFGSCSFNITLIVLLNAFMGGGSILRKVNTLHTLTSSFGLALIGLALMGIVLVGKFSGHPLMAQWMELTWALAILVAYFGCMRLVYRHQRRENGSGSGSAKRQKVGGALCAQLAFCAAVIVAASWWLALLGDVLSTHKIDLIGRPLGATFVGAGFLALATSLPEIVTSIAAVRLGDLDLALGNIFGSNMFNIFVIPVLKVVSMVSGEPLLLPVGTAVSTDKLITGLLAILLTAIAVGGLAYQSRRKVLRRFGFDSVLIAVTYVGGMILLLIDSG